MDITCITVDCHDPAGVARFWSAALGWADLRVSESGDGASCHPPGGGAYLEFIRVPERKEVKNRLHLGCNAGALDRMDDEIERLEALGAEQAWEELFPADLSGRYRNVVMRDVEGNEFCLGAGEAAG